MGGSLQPPHARTVGKIHRVLSSWRNMLGAMLPGRNRHRDAPSDSTGQRESLLATYQQELLRRLFDNAPFGIAVINPADGRYLLANPRYEATAGVPAGRLVGHKVGEFAPPKLARFMQRLLRRVIRTGRPFTVREYEANFGPGREHTFWNNDVVPLLDADGRVEAVLAITHDVTSQVQAQAQLRESQSQLRHLAQNVREVFWLGLPDWNRVLYVNPAYERIWGRSCESLYQSPRSWLDGVAPEDQQAIKTALGDGVFGQVATTLPDYRVLRPDGTIRWVRAWAWPIHDEAGTLCFVAGIAEDITDQKHAQDAELKYRRQAQELEHTATELARSNKDLQQFAHFASHDLQEPLRMIKGFLDLLTQKLQGQLDQDAQTYIAFAVDGAVRMQGLISGLLDYSRAGAKEITFRPVGCEAVLAEVLNNLQVSIQEAQALVTHDPLPTVEGDAIRLAQVFQNLISNAVKYRAEGRRPEIHVGCGLVEGSWQFSVRDNGIGIEPRFADRIFGMFQRLHGPGKYVGSGIGLAICKTTIERHGGRIWVESQPDQGSVFYFTLPQTASPAIPGS